jgi:hypothetical protein
MKKMMLLVLLGTLLNAKALDLRQIFTLKTVKNVALNHPNKKGETFEKTMMAICMTETSCGRENFGDKQLLKKGIKKASYGVMQVRLETARFVAKVHNLFDVKLMSDVELIEKMMHNSAFNAKIAVLYIVWLSDHSKSYFEMVSRYNGGKVNHPYYNRVQKNMRLLSRYRL